MYTVMTRILFFFKQHSIIHSNDSLHLLPHLNQREMTTGREKIKVKMSPCLSIIARIEGRSSVQVVSGQQSASHSCYFIYHKRKNHRMLFEHKTDLKIIMITS